MLAHLSKAAIERIQPLPVVAVLPALNDALAARDAAVLVAPPGAGKTTVVPLALLAVDWLAGRSILMLEPRRLAARAAARRMARLLGEPVGHTVGYRMRLESCVGPQTRIEVLTEGVFTRMLQSDPAIPRAGLVIFDEFHERHLDADLGLALCRDIQGVLNEPLRLLVMSATLEAAPVAALLGDAPLITCSGQTHPVTTHYLPRPVSGPIETEMTQAILRSVARDEGNLLAFLPGGPEIRRVARRLADVNLPATWQVWPLYGLLSPEAQDAALAPPPTGRRKIVLTTAIAESSLTIDGISVVLDAGLSRGPRFDVRSGLTRLATFPVSLATADQRRGRAGRLGPGICYRLWTEAQTATLAPQPRPEILDADLTRLALELALWGLTTPSSLPWLDPPPAAAFSQARTLLTALGALDDGGGITAHGRRMAGLPLPPRLAHMVLAANSEGMGTAACDLAALLSERDPLRFPAGAGDADLDLRLDALHAVRSGRPTSFRDAAIDATLCRRILTMADRLRRTVGIHIREATARDTGRLLAWAYPDRIARQRPGERGRYILANGRGAWLDPATPLGAQEYLVAADLDGERRDARIFLAAAYRLETLQAQFSHEFRTRNQVVWDSRRQSVIATRSVWYGALPLSNEPLENPDPEAKTAALAAGIRLQGLDCLPWTPELRHWQARVTLLRRTEGPETDWPEVTDEALAATLDEWLAPHLQGMTRLKDLGRLNLKAILGSRLTHHQRQALEELTPTHVTTPAGIRRPIDYCAESPSLAVRLQDLFGLNTTPAILQGRLPLRLVLLSPAGRPAQVTQDLPGFWRNSYPEVKKALKGRYPKHAWPDDPLSAPPGRKGR